MTQSTVQLSVAQGERIAVMGSSGSGKSSLLNLVCGLDDPTTGTVRVAGIKISDLNHDQRSCLRREKIGMIFQTFNLLPTLSAVENAALPLRLQGMRRKQAEQGAAAMPERVGLRTLRGDEPTGNLDSATGEEILALLDDLRQGVQQRPVSGDAQRPCRQLLRSCGHPSRWSHGKRTAAHTALARSRA
jgi:ABC-type lipoprotein export system ATPase subunit